MRTIFFVLLLVIWTMALFAQETTEKEKKEPPKLKIVRAEENYSYLKDKDTNPYESDIFDVLKLIPLSKNKAFYFTLGGEFRPRGEFFINRAWEEEDVFYYSQRLSLHTNIQLSKYVRVFGEFYHGFTSHEPEIVEYDLIDWHQGFVEVKLPFKKNTMHLSLRFGRQELGLGAARLVGLREGPNIRRTFDLARTIYHYKSTTAQIFYGKEVRPSFGAFDNTFSLFNETAPNPKLWGAYVQFSIKKISGKNELYYLGFHSKNAAFADITGEEIRHTIGLRRFGAIKKWKYNTELIYQFGALDGNTISAFNFETDWHFVFEGTKWEPNIGLKLDFSSGDFFSGDNQLNTFNPMFVNPAIYSLSGLITPVNLISIHPSLTLTPVKNLRVYIDFGWFLRTSLNDGLYQPPRFVRRTNSGATERYIGSQLGFEIDYELNRHIMFMLDFSYFFPGDFIHQTGEAFNTMHIATTVSFKF